MPLRGILSKIVLKETGISPGMLDSLCKWKRDEDYPPANFRLVLPIGIGIMESIFYFAYSHHMDASNLRSLGIPIYSNCAGMVQGYRLEFNVLEDELYRFENRGMANIMPCSGSIVEGILFEIDENAVPVLDKDAGVSLLKYYRKMVPVITENGENIQAVSYAAWPDMTSKGLYPSEKYLALILTAARQPGISNQYCSWLESHATVV